MLILSKYKDYYDYLAGIYGVDTKLILDRREGKIVRYLLPDKFSVQKLVIFDLVYEFVIDSRANWYYGDKLSLIGKFKKHWITGKKGYVINLSKKYDVFVSPTPYKAHHKLKEKAPDCPILYVSDEEIIKWPRLWDFPTPAVIPPDEIYQKISTWLASKIEPPIQDNMTDKEKIKSHGFDIIKSFRNIKR